MTTTSNTPWPEGTDPGATSPGTTLQPQLPPDGGPSSGGSFGADAADTSGGGGVKDVAQEQAGQLKDHAAGAGRQVAGTAKDQAVDVASDAKAQAKDLLGRTRDQVDDQAATQKGKAVDGLRSLSSQLRSMAEDSEQSGTVTQLARQGSETSDRVADFLDRRDPSQLVDEVRTFARRRPGAFLLGAALAGVVGGRLTRGLKSASSDDSGSPTRAEPTGAADNALPYGSGPGGLPVDAGDPYGIRYGEPVPGALGYGQPVAGAPAYPDPGYPDPGYPDPGYPEPGPVVR